MTRDDIVFSISSAGPSSQVKTPEISSTLSAISRRTLPKGSAARPSAVSSSSTTSNVDDVQSYESLPARYRRKPLSQDEIEFIEVC